MGRSWWDPNNTSSLARFGSSIRGCGRSQDVHDARYWLLDTSVVGQTVITADLERLVRPRPRAAALTWARPMDGG